MRFTCAQDLVHDSSEYHYTVVNIITEYSDTADIVFTTMLL